MKRFVVILLLLAGCSGSVPDAALRAPDGMLHPKPRPGSGATIAPPSGAVTVEAFDTTSAAERAAAAAPVPAAEVKLGRTVAALGNPADPGFWLETPLTDRVRPGRVVAVASGASVQLELRPLDGPAGAGSRLSLPALRLLNISLTGLHELDVFGR